MSAENISDDYVAELLAKDAKDSSLKYSALGMQAFLPNKAPANHPKPNTRFLRNIIRETDSHNQALLAKEAEDARARLRGLSGGERKQESRSASSGRDVRKRQLGAIAAILSAPSATRKRDRTGDTQSNRDSSDRTDRERQHRRSHRHEDDGKPERGERSERRHRRSRSPSKERSEGRRRHRSRSREHRSRHRHSERLSRSRSRSPRESRRHHKHSDRDSKSRSRRHDKVTKDDDSDPLEDIIGPQPPDPTPKIRSRGRGTVSSASGIDSRFSSNYDPAADVALHPEEEDDWDQALEALRDRTKWKKQGADRLRAAGFTEEEIGKWERGGEKREEDVRWKGKGESREWDRGKVVDKDSVEIDVGWGRLKDN